MGDRILSLGQACLCGMPQLLPALCLPEPSASSHSLCTRTRAHACVYTHTLTHTHTASCFHLSVSFQHPCLLLQKTPAMIGGSDHSTCPQYSFSSDFLESSLSLKSACLIKLYDFIFCLKKRKV